MEASQLVVLALLQGLTEFLPISSSGHLVLLPSLVGWPDQGLAFDVAVHVGTLVAVLVYFRADLWVIARDWLRSVLERREVGMSMLGWAVIVATIPGGMCGLLLGSYSADLMRSSTLIGITTIVFGVALWWADRAGKQQRDERSLTWRDVAVIGCAQALALIPGTSRSGVTMTAGIAMGLTRSAAARFSFLLSIPIILAAGLFKAVEAMSVPAPVGWGGLGLGAAISAVAAYLCIHFFLKLLERVGFLPFVIYRLALGAIVLAMV